MAAASPKEGKGKCPSCQGDVWFRRSAGGLLKYKCEHCDSGGFADQNGDAERAWLATITTKPAPQPAQNDPAPTPHPAPRKPASAFNLADL